MSSDHDSVPSQRESQSLRPRYAVIMSRPGLWDGELYDWPPDPNFEKLSPRGFLVGSFAETATRWSWRPHPRLSEPFLIIGSCYWLIKKSWDTHNAFAAAGTDWLRRDNCTSQARGLGPSSVLGNDYARGSASAMLVPVRYRTSGSRRFNGGAQQGVPIGALPCC